MSTHATTTDAPEARRTTHRAPAPRVHLGGVIRSEWIKLTSVRSAWWAIAVAIVVSAGFSALAALATYSTAPEGAAEQGFLADVPLAALGTAGLPVAQLVFAVLGVIVIAGEYGSGQIRSTLTAVPTRLPVLAAKAIVLGATAFVSGAVAIALGYAATIGIASANGVALDDLAIDGSIALSVLGGALYLALLAVFSLAVGALLRSSAGGIAVAVGLLLVLPVLTGIIPFDWVQDAAPYLLANAGMVLGAPADAADGDVLRAVLVVVAWATAGLVAAAASLTRRDA